MYQVVDLFPLIHVLDRLFFGVGPPGTCHFLQSEKAAGHVVILCMDADLRLDSHAKKSFDESLQYSLMVCSIRVRE